MAGKGQDRTRVETQTAAKEEDRIRIETQRYTVMTGTERGNGQEKKKENNVTGCKRLKDTQEKKK